MLKATLTKSRRRRKNESLRKQSAKLFDENMGPIPELAKELGTALGCNIEVFKKQSAVERAPSHFVQYDECPELDQTVLARMTKKASEDRALDRDRQISELRIKYVGYWGRRGGAKIIASLETDDGNPLSERTVQKYFKETKK